MATVTADLPTCRPADLPTGLKSVFICMAHVRDFDDATIFWAVLPNCPSMMGALGESD